TSAIERCREAAKGDDAEKIKSSLEELEQASHGLTKSLYENTGAQAAAPGAEAASGDDGSADTADDDAIDAEFEVKKD
ncbi:MAG: molecular chaperone DnaK, partial [Pirellulales bacterium]